MRRRTSSVWKSGFETQVICLHLSGLASVSNGKVTTNKDFDNLSSQIAKVTPSGVKMDSYNPTNTAASACPSVTAGKWEAKSSPLPPVVNDDACTCMMSTLGCVVADNVGDKDFGDMFGFICGEKSGKYCSGINKNATSGPYGAYGMCSNKQQLSFAVNAYAKAVPGGCNFKGKATSKSAQATPTAAGCGTLLQAAGTEGTGVVSGAPKASGSGAAKGSQAGASGLYASQFSNGVFGLGMYVVGAVASGMAMILL